MGLFNLNGDKIRTPDYKTSFSLFRNFSVIGDSFAATMADSNISWPLIIERKTGSKCYNFSYGGLSTKKWLTNADYGLPKMQASPATELYIVALGINDKGQNITIGTIADIESNSIDSFYSYYGRIIRAIRSHSPNAIIMLSTIARLSSDYIPYSNAIIAIGEYYNIAVFNLAKNVLFNSDFFINYQQTAHPMAVARSAMAEEYIYLVENELETNISKYLNYKGIV